MGNVSRETLGRVVRTAWIDWAQEQRYQKQSWLVPWESLSEPYKEVDRRIGEAVAEYVSRETKDEPLLFWRLCAADSSMLVAGKIEWLKASYEHLIKLAGFSMPQDRLDATIGTAALMSRLTDLLLETVGTDAEIDKFIVRWLCFACDQLWEFVPEEARHGDGDVDPDAPQYNQWMAEMERRLPSLIGLPGGVGERLAVVCPRCNAVHSYPPARSLCPICRAPLNHIKPVPYSTAIHEDR